MEVLNNKDNDTASIGWTNLYNDISMPDHKIYSGTDMLWYGYIEGYKTAADYLADLHFEDAMVFPVVFCYRQYVELVLKNIYRKYESDTFVKWINKVQHDFSKILKCRISERRNVLDMLDILSSNNSDINISDIKKIVDIFITVDQSSFAFRYPIDKKQGTDSSEPLVNKHGVNGEVKINLLNLKKNIDYFDDMLYSTYNDGECVIPSNLIVF